tara:strand:+ start:100 stop:621 length:522 start_codon:yes stop_codon:yes gene_type:complete
MALTKLQAGGVASNLLASNLSLSGTSTSINVDPTGYNHLLIYIYHTDAGSSYELSVRFNSDSGSNYKYMRTVEDANGSASVDGGVTTSLFLNQTGAAGFASGTTNNYHVIKAFFVNENDVWKTIESNTIQDTGTADIQMFNAAHWRNTAAVSSVQVISTVALTSGEIKIYGVF